MNNFLSKVIKFSLTQRLLVLISILVLLGFGLNSFLNLPIDAFPDVSGVQVKIILKSPGMTPEEVENRIVIPIEQEMLGIPKQKLLRSTSKYAITDITIDFEDGTDLYWARQQVSERLNGVLSSLPNNITGGLAPITTPLSEIFMFTIEGDISLEEKRKILDFTIRPQLRVISGVADVNSLGGFVAAFEVLPRHNDLSSRKISLKDLQDVILNNNKNDGAGRISDGEESLLIRSNGGFKSIEDIKNIVIKTNEESIVKLADVADVKFGSLNRYGAVTKDGNEAVEGLVLGLKGANAQKTIKNIKAKLETIQKSLPPNVKVVSFYERSTLVEKAIKTVAKSLAEAIIFVVLLLLFFLGNIRAALVVSIMLPLSALSTFILMSFFGISANLMSLGGLAIAIGMLVDAAVVVVENIESQLAEDNKVSFMHTIYRASSDVALPMVSGIFIIIIVFLPLLTLEGLEGKMFAPVALTIIFALASSLILSLTIVPVVASLLLKQEHKEESLVIKKINSFYDEILKLSFNNKNKIFIASVVVLVLAMVSYIFLGKSFMPKMDEGDLIMQVEKIPSINLDRTIEIDKKIQNILLEKIPEIKSIVARSGSDELGLDPMGLNQTDTFIVLNPKETWRKNDVDWLMEEIRLVMSNYSGITFSFTQPIEMRVAEMLTGVRGDLAIKIYGSDLNTLNNLASKIELAVKNIKGAEDTFTVKNDGVQYLQIDFDRNAMGYFGFSIEEVQMELKTLIDGQNMGIVILDGKKTPILIKGNKDLQKSISDFKGIKLMNKKGVSVDLLSIVKFNRVDGPVKIDRENARRFVVVQSNVSGRDLVGFVDDAKLIIQKMDIPNNYEITWGGQFENQQRAAAKLLMVIPLSLLIIFFLLFSTFNSIRQSLLILSNVPFALVGGIISLFISNEYLSVPASVGFIALLGIAVLNGVVMVTYFNQLLNEGMLLRSVVIEGAKRRLRPVLMTASITAFGLIPMIFASGPGAEIQKPLAIVVIGGLITSTILTLVLLPILFEKFGVGEKNE